MKSFLGSNQKVRQNWHCFNDCFAVYYFCQISYSFSCSPNTPQKSSFTQVLRHVDPPMQHHLLCCYLNCDSLCCLNSINRNFLGFLMHPQHHHDVYQILSSQYFGNLIVSAQMNQLELDGFGQISKCFDQNCGHFNDCYSIMILHFIVIKKIVMYTISRLN